jgi:hypothetical protein
MVVPLRVSAIKLENHNTPPPLQVKWLFPNLKGGYVFFLKKIFWFPMFASCDNKINILTLVLSEKKILNETKNHNHNPPSS